MEIYAVNAIIFDQYNRILLTLRQDMPMWNIPGGGVEEEETPLIAVQREIKEELSGMNVTFVRNLGIYIKSNENMGVQAFVFNTIYSDNLVVVQPDDEEIKWKFFHHNELPANIWPPHKSRILHAYQGLLDMYEEISNFDDKEEMAKIPLDLYVDLEYWLAHPSVLKNKENGIIRFWPLSE